MKGKTFQNMIRYDSEFIVHNDSRFIEIFGYDDHSSMA